MKIVRIFVSDNSANGLWAIRFGHEQKDEFVKFFDLMNDIEWLHSFFDENISDLTSGFLGNISVEEAIQKTLEEAEEMEGTLYDYAEQGFDEGLYHLQYIFKPLNNYEYAITILQKSKARIKKGWLRLYAIRLAENCYLVTGGAIKLTQDMKRPHLQYEIKKLEQVKNFLRCNGIEYPEDLNTYYDE